ncbi:hypothetical protein SH528x_001468 [Novipirellula sp. SH528]|uniref:hypothetical protein n=1 Tax=Novipirellula sp. SH528 TaxID=3454466 RepID=UPI003FA13248
MNERQRLGKPSDNGLAQGDFDSRIWDRRIVGLNLFACPPHSSVNKSIVAAYNAIILAINGGLPMKRFVFG